jgi:gluconolactonase
MKRLLSLFLVLPIGIYAACSSSGADRAGATPPAPGAGGDPAVIGDAGGGPEGDAAIATPEEMTKNPIEGIAAAKIAIDTGAFTSGPVWSVKESVLFFTTPLGAGALYRLKPDGTATKVRDGIAGQLPIGNTIDKAGNLFAVEDKRITRGSASADAGAPTVIATGYDEVGADAGPTAFDTLKDAVVGATGTVYATDPGYFAAPIANHIFRITPAGKVIVVEAFPDVPRPNGLALTPDGKGLYIGFTQPTMGTKPFIRKYAVNADGTLGAQATFVELDADTQPDGIEVDQAGNVFVATKGGIAVFRSDATKIGVVAVPEQPTACAFGGTDLKTLYITTQGTHIFQITTNVPGIVQ